MNQTATVPPWVASSPETADLIARQRDISRDDLPMGEMSDFEFANALFMVSRMDLELIHYQTAAKERIRWLSVQLADALANRDPAFEVSPLPVQRVKKFFVEGAEYVPETEAWRLALEKLAVTIDTEILPNWDRNGPDDGPGVQWLSQTEWMEVASWIRQQATVSQTPPATKLVEGWRVEAISGGDVIAGYSLRAADGNVIATFDSRKEAEQVRDALISAMQAALSSTKTEEEVRADERERCAADLERHADTYPLGHEQPTKGASTYNWLKWSASLLRSLQQKEN